MTVCAVCLRCKRLQPVVNKRTKSDRLARLCRLPPSLVASSQNHDEYRVDRVHELQEPILTVDCPLDRQLWPTSIFAQGGPPAFAAPGAELGVGGGLQVLVGGMVTEYNPTYEHGGLMRTALVSKGHGLASEHGLDEIAADRLQLIR